MLRIWSDSRRAGEGAGGGRRRRSAWLALWGVIAWSVYQALAGFADAGRIIRDGGETMIESGRNLGAALSGVPLVGDGLRGVAGAAFAGAVNTLVSFGTDRRGFDPPGRGASWRLCSSSSDHPLADPLRPVALERLQAHAVPAIAPSDRAGSAARRGPRGPRAARGHAARLRHLLEFTPDPLGDWVAGRHDRLARAELASVGLAP